MDEVQRAKPSRIEPSVLGSGFHLGRILGVRVQVDFSLLLVFGLVMMNLGGGVLPSWHPEWSWMLTWTVALAAAIAFFASVLVHELSHALVARRYGIPVPRITLFLFGGLAHMEREPPSPKSELLMAAVGPLTSLAIGAVATLAGSFMAADAIDFSQDPSTATALGERFANVGPVASLLLWLGPINIALGVFNLVPGFPLDGGRVLRAILWWRTQDFAKATRWASTVGKLFAWGLMAFGVMSLFAGVFGQGIWLLLIGWFLNNAARASYRQVEVRQALHDVPVERVMWTEPLVVSPDLTLDQLVDRYVMASNQTAFPVEEQAVLVGMVVLDDVRKVPQSQWSEQKVSDVMTPAERLRTLPLHAGAEQALDELARHDVDQIPVLEGRALRGLVRRRDLVKWLALHSETAAAA